jgi:hypothetical protein
LDERYNEIH